VTPAGPGKVPVPADWRLRPDPATRVVAGGTVVLGGTPLRVLTLAPAGSRLVDSWFAGAPVGVGEGEGRLARRMLDAGLAHPEPVGGPHLDELTVVIPVRDRPEELRRCLAALDRRLRVVVVDDGSADGSAVTSIAAEHDAQVVRLDGQATAGGPGAARNAGLAVATTPFVAFVDSDCVVGPGFPGRLLAHLDDPAVALVAPRIVALEPGRGSLATYEAHHSALDMGPAEARVAPGTALPYVPSAALVARVAALGTGFDTALGYGEDVDLVWRLDRAGWQVRYDPAATVAHDHRVRVWPWFARRVGYDTATAPLALLHPGHLPALVLSRAGAATLLALLVGRPGIAVATTASGVVALRSRLAPRLPRATTAAVRLVLRGQLHEGRELARTLAGPWLPATLLVARLHPPLGRRAAALVAARLALEWARVRREPTPLHYAAPRLASDVARCIGVTIGCIRHRTTQPLRLRIR
jgi:mycofactocin system glycosyltransferase